MPIADIESPETPVTPVVADSLFEVVNDRRVEKPPVGAYGTRIGFLLGSEIEQFAKVKGVGRGVTEMLFRIKSKPNLQRRPDVAFVSFDRWPKGRRLPSTNALDVVPELVVVVISPTNLAEEIPTRVSEYFEAGVRRAWVI